MERQERRRAGLGCKNVTSSRDFAIVVDIQYLCGGQDCFMLFPLHAAFLHQKCFRPIFSTYFLFASHNFSVSLTLYCKKSGSLKFIKGDL